MLKAGAPGAAAPPPPPPLLTSWPEVTLRRAGAPVPKPVLLRAAASALPVDQGPAASYLRIVLRGRHLAGPGVALLARLGGTALPVEVVRHGPAPAAALLLASSSSPLAAVAEDGEDDTATSAYASASAAAARKKQQEKKGKEEDGGGEEEEVELEIDLPEDAPRQGLLLIEPRAGFLLGEWLPVSRGGRPAGRARMHAWAVPNPACCADLCDEPSTPAALGRAHGVTRLLAQRCGTNKAHLQQATCPSGPFPHPQPSSSLRARALPIRQWLLLLPRRPVVAADPAGGRAGGGRRGAAAGAGAGRRAQQVRRSSRRSSGR